MRSPMPRSGLRRQSVSRCARTSRADQTGCAVDHDVYIVVDGDQVRAYPRKIMLNTWRPSAVVTSPMPTRKKSVARMLAR